MEIRQLTLSNFNAFLDLEGYAFHYVVDEGRTEKVRKIWENAIGLGAFSDAGELQSALLIRPYTVFLHGKSVKMGGIGDVASYPEARGQGNVRQLFQVALNRMREQGVVLSYLAPFSYAFYRQFGYELVFEERSYTIKPAEFGRLDSGNRKVHRVKWEEEKDTLIYLYTQKHRQSIGPVIREEWAWEEKRRWTDGLYVALCTDETGQAEGYAIYHFKSSSPYAFVVDELVALTGQAEKALWQFVASHGPQFAHFEYRSSAAENLTHLFPEPRVEQKWQSGMSARIVDMEVFLNQYPFETTKNATFLLKVIDTTAEWNHSSFKLEIAEQGISVMKVDEEEPGHPVLEADIQTWTQLLMGTRTAEQLQFNGNLLTDLQYAQEFQSLLKDGTPELYDYF